MNVDIELKRRVEPLKQGDGAGLGIVGTVAGRAAIAAHVHLPSGIQFRRIAEDPTILHGITLVGVQGPPRRSRKADHIRAVWAYGVTHPTSRPRETRAAVKANAGPVVARVWRGGGHTHAASTHF